MQLTPTIAIHMTAALAALALGPLVVAGIFTLLPQRFLGQLVFSQWLGLA